MELTSIARVELANGHIGLQHIIMEGRCEQLAVLEPLGSVKDQQAIPWGGRKAGVLVSPDTPAPPLAAWA